MTTLQKEKRNAYMRSYRVKNLKRSREIGRESSRKSYENNRDKIAEKAEARAAKVAEIKHIRGCKECDESDTRCLDFHHRDPEHKVDNVAQMVRTCSWNRVMTEIEKCDVLCSNCHRKLIHKKDDE